MEAVEINAGELYLRQLRADDRVDDCATLVEAFADPEIRRWLNGRSIEDYDAAREYVEFRAWQWASDQHYSWAVCDSVLGDVVGEVGLRNLDPHHGSAEMVCWTHPGRRGRGVATHALAATLNFGFHGVGLHRVAYRHAVGNRASQRVAEKCGFTLEGRVREAQLVDDVREDLLLWSRLATDSLP